MVANHAVLIGVSIVFVLPILFMILTALMTDQQALSTKLIPSPVEWKNFWTVFKQIDLARYTWNTFLYAGLSTIGVVVSSVPVAYAFIYWVMPLLGIVYPILTALAIVATLVVVNLVLVAMLPMFERRAEKLTDAWLAILVALGVSFAEIWLAGLLRDGLNALVRTLVRR